MNIKFFATLSRSKRLDDQLSAWLALISVIGLTGTLLRFLATRDNNWLIATMTLAGCALAAAAYPWAQGHLDKKKSPCPRNNVNGA